MNWGETQGQQAKWHKQDLLFLPVYTPRRDARHTQGELKSKYYSYIVNADHRERFGLVCRGLRMKTGSAVISDTILLRRLWKWIQWAAWLQVQTYGSHDRRIRVQLYIYTVGGGGGAIIREDVSTLTDVEKLPCSVFTCQEGFCQHI